MKAHIARNQNAGIPLALGWNLSAAARGILEGMAPAFGMKRQLVSPADAGRTVAQLLGEVEGVEDEIDTTTEALRSHHMDRLKNHKCSAKIGMIYLDMLTNLERIGDHAENIATSAKSATGI